MLRHWGYIRLLEATWSVQAEGTLFTTVTVSVSCYYVATIATKF